MTILPAQRVLIEVSAKKNDEKKDAAMDGQAMFSFFVILSKTLRRTVGLNFFDFSRLKFSKMRLAFTQTMKNC